MDCAATRITAAGAKYGRCPTPLGSYMIPSELVSRLGLINIYCAFREIESLRFKVRGLKEQLSDQSRLIQSGGVSSLRNSLESSAAAVRSPGVHKTYWEGIHMRVTQSGQAQYYGPSSLLYFISRMTSYIATALQEPHHEHHMQLNSARKSFSSPTSPRRSNSQDKLVSVVPTPMGGEHLTEIQEDYFLGLFWQSYHCLYHILDEAEFREHYKSLWTTPGAPRNPSALVDIVLAMCMQYGVAFLPRHDVNIDPKADVNGNDATIAGRWFYQRCQSLLAEELESPSITTLQCYIFSVVYLCNASFQNTAHSILALAIRTAQTLGLHLEPPEDMPRVQRESRKRLWWTLFALESQECMELGRPWVVQIPRVTCTLPSDDQELAMLSGAHSVSTGGGNSVTCLTWILQNIKLILATRAIHTAFYAKCAEVLDINDGKSLYNNPESLETCAGFLQSSMSSLQSWSAELPDALKTPRKGNGTPLSTDRSALDVQTFAPLWLQRQRLLLELRYHTLVMSLYQPFISFVRPFSSRPRPLTEANSICCLNHAMTLTHMTRQVLAETDILGGWHEAFRWQWNAALSTIGIVLAYPVHPCTPAARRAVAVAVAVFEIFSDNFAVAVSAAAIIRDVAAKADVLVSRFRTGAADGAAQPPLTYSSPEPSAKNSRDSMQSFAASPKLQSNWQFESVSSVIAQFGNSDGEGGGDSGETESATMMMMGPQNDLTCDTTDLSSVQESFSELKPVWETGESMLTMWGLMQEH